MSETTCRNCAFYMGGMQMNRAPDGVPGVSTIHDEGRWTRPVRLLFWDRQWNGHVFPWHYCPKHTPKEQAS